MDIFFDNEFRSLIPPLQPDEYTKLENSLLNEGNRDSVIIWKETRLLLDGHNRYDICHKHNIPLKPPLELSFPDRDDAAIWIIRNQFGRRNLSPYQRSVLALKLEDLFREKAKGRQGNRTDLGNIPQNSAESRDELAEVARVSHDTIVKVKKIEAEATPEQKEKLITGKATINQVYVTIHREEIRQSLKTTKWPTGKYRVIYADPPWQYDNHNPADRFVEQSDYYPTLSISQICALPVPDICNEDAVLFLWVTSPVLEQSFGVLKAWGFKYKACFVWDKVKHVMGHYNSVRHEFLLVATKGSCQPDVMKLFDSVQVIERNGQHSRKPALFRDIINTIYPYGPRIEIFATEKIEGWDIYGSKISA